MGGDDVAAGQGSCWSEDRILGFKGSLQCMGFLSFLVGVLFLVFFKSGCLVTLN